MPVSPRTAVALAKASDPDLNLTWAEQLGAGTDQVPTDEVDHHIPQNCLQMGSSVVSGCKGWRQPCYDLTESLRPIPQLLQNVDRAVQEGGGEEGALSLFHQAPHPDGGLSAALLLDTGAAALRRPLPLLLERLLGRLLAALGGQQRHLAVALRSGRQSCQPRHIVSSVFASPQRRRHCGGAMQQQGTCI